MKDEYIIENIIKENNSFPHLAELRNKNPEEYINITKEIIQNKLSKTLPFFLKWQERNNEFPVYESSLMNLAEVLSSLDYSIYDNGLEGKIELTDQFYSVCRSYKFSDIASLSENFDPNTSLKIKNLINRSFKKYYSNRKRIVSNIKKYQPSFIEEEYSTLLNYAPFQNSEIGIEWLSKLNITSMSKLCNSWIVLLCIDIEKFSPNTFIFDLIDFIGKENTEKLVNRLAIFLAGLPYKKTIFTPIERSLKKTVDKYRRVLSSNRIVHIQLKDLKIGSNKIKYDNYSYILPKKLNQSQLILLKSKFFSKEEVSLVIPKEENVSNETFRFLYPQEEEYIINKVNETNKTIATNIRATELKFRKSVISFKDSTGKTYYLRSVKILDKVNFSILEMIDHSFTLVRDKSLVKGQNIELRFLFEPSNDLSFLLAEIERFSRHDNIAIDTTFPQTGEFEIPWKFVRFQEGIMAIFHPNPSKRGTLTPFYFRNSEILKSFEDIRPYIEKRCSKLKVRTADGVIIDLLNYYEFRLGITQYNDWEEVENIGVDLPINANKHYGFSKDTFIRNASIRKSPYLSYLATLQHNDFKIIYTLERVIHQSGSVDTDEYGYLFVLKKDIKNMVLLYENITDSSRSSILFYIDPEYYTESVEIIRKFLASEIKNKRQKLSFGQIQFNSPFIREIKRIKHSNIIDWRFILNEYIS